MSKKSRKQRKKQRPQKGVSATARQARPEPLPTPPVEAAAAPAAEVSVPVEPVEIVAAIVEQVAHAFDDAPPEPQPQPQVDPAVEEAHAPVAETAPSGTHPTAATNDNRRKHPRIALTVEIDLASESHFFSGLSGDVSEGGVFVETYRDIPVGSEVALQFELPNGSIHAHGAVKWHRDKSDTSPPGVGVEFDDVSAEDKKLIAAFCARRAPLYYEVAS